MALIHNKTLRITTIYLANSGESVRLLPGICEIEDKDLAEIKTHPSFKARLQRQEMIIMSETKDGRKSVSEMVEDMPKIFDIKLLKKFIKEDKREPIVQAAQQQLDTIMNPGKAGNEHFS